MKVQLQLIGIITIILCFHVTYTVQRMIEIWAKLLLKSRLVSEKSRVMDSLRSSQEKDQSCRQARSRIDESHKQRERLTFSMLTLLFVTSHISIGSMNLELSISDTLDYIWCT